MLRNPGEQPQQFLLDVGVAFELPVGATSRYTLKSPWAEDVNEPALSATAGMPKNISLQPFEVAIWDATPTRE